MMKSYLIFVGLIFLIIGCDSDSNLNSTSSADQRTIVGPTKTIEVPGMYPRIQQAINAAGSGDFIRVAAGVYAENIEVIGKDISLRGAGIGVSIIQGRIKVYDTSETSIEGFTVQGGGIHARNSPVRISGNEIIESPEAGLWLESCSNSVISGNTINNNGEGIVVDDSLVGVIGSNSVEYNQTDGVVINNSSPTLQNNLISSNGRDGLAIRGFTSYATPLLLSNTIRDNGDVSNYDIICFGSDTNPTGVGNIFGDCINCAECRSFGDPVTYQD